MKSDVSKKVAAILLVNSFWNSLNC